MATADTKEKILAAAEALFARQGFAATSLRNVIADAGVNLAAVHYHFGSKEELVRAVFAWRFDPINEERLRLLAALESQSSRSRSYIEDVLACLILPIIRASRDESDGWSMVGALVGRVHSEPDVSVRQIFYDQFEVVSERFLKALASALPELSAEELFYRFHFSIAAMAASLVNPDEVRFLSKGRIDAKADPERFVKRWATYVAAGLRAAPTATEGAPKARKSSTETGRKPTAKSVAKPAAKSALKPAAKPPVTPAVKPAAPSTTKSTIKPAPRAAPSTRRKAPSRSAAPKSRKR